MLFLAFQDRLVVFPRPLIDNARDAAIVCAPYSQKHLQDFAWSSGLESETVSGMGDEDSDTDVSSRYSESSDDRNSHSVLHWRILCGPKHLGKTTRLLSTACSALAMQEYLGDIRGRLVSSGYHPRTFQDISKIHPATALGDCIWLDMRGVTRKSSFIATVAAQLGITESSFPELEKSTEKFFLGLKPGSTVSRFLLHSSSFLCSIIHKVSSLQVA